MSICLVGSSGLGVVEHSWRDAVASGASGSPCSSPRRAAFSSGVGFHHLLAPRAKPLLSHPHLDTSKVPCTSAALVQHCRGPQSVPLTSLHNTAELLPWLGFFLPNSLEVPHFIDISMRQEILRMQPMKTGMRIPPAQCLLVCHGQPEGHSLPPRKVQDLGFTEVPLYGVPFEGPNLLPPARVIAYPVHLCLDPSVRVVHWVRHPFEPRCGLRLSRS